MLISSKEDAMGYSNLECQGGNDNGSFVKDWWEPSISLAFVLFKWKIPGPNFAFFGVCQIGICRYLGIDSLLHFSQSLLRSPLVKAHHVDQGCYSSPSCSRWKGTNVSDSRLTANKF